jgi:heme-degrading monooxygenase HmoA
MIARIWYGWTTPANADAYESLLRGEVFPGILARGIRGFHSIELLRRKIDEEVEFITIMKFDSMDAILAFAGADRATAVVLPKARALLARFDERSAHYDIAESRAP